MISRGAGTGPSGAGFFAPFAFAGCGIMPASLWSSAMNSFTDAAQSSQMQACSEGTTSTPSAALRPQKEQTGPTGGWGVFLVAMDSGLLRNEHLVDQPPRARLLGAHEVVAVRVAHDLLHRLAGVGGEDFIELLLET